jgi:molecular chaperone GrpE
MSTTDGAAEPKGPTSEDFVPPDVESDVDSDEALRALHEAADEAQDRWRRAVAELDNLRKRCARQLIEERAAGRAEAAAQWLPVVDNLERALESARGSEPAAPIVEGVRAVRDQAVSVLAGLGFPRHAEARVPFDPYVHEALGVDYDADAEPGTVVHVVRPGYGEGERQLRPAGVVVAGQRR